MATRKEIILVDDVDGGDAAETVSFGLDGTFYELDLSKQNAANLRKSISGFVEHARRVGGRAKRGTAKRASHEVAEVRTWAQNNGYKVSARGRISADVQQAFDEAQR